MKKILILANNSGGLYRFRKELISSLISDGNEVVAAIPFDDNIEELCKLGVTLKEIKLSRRGMNPIKDFGLLIMYYNIIHEIKPDFVLTYTIKPNLYGCTVARLLKIPYVINITGLGSAFQNDNLIKKMVISWYKFVSKKVNVIFFENRGNKDIFVENKIVTEDKCCVLNGAGVNLKDFDFREYPKDDKFIHFLFIGRIMKEKGVDELFWSIEKIHQENKNIVLDILGTYEDNYMKKIEELTNKNIVNFYGYQEDVRPYIENCHCFVLPSYHEGMANTLLECAAMGRPLITSDIHGCKEAIKENGFLCKSKDCDSLYQQISKFIDLDYHDKKQLGLNSRIHIENVFDKNKIVKNTVNQLKKNDLL